jgi:hypothetical protein
MFAAQRCDNVVGLTGTFISTKLIAVLGVGFDQVRVQSDPLGILRRFDMTDLLACIHHHACMAQSVTRSWYKYSRIRSVCGSTNSQMN